MALRYDASSLNEPSGERQKSELSLRLPSRRRTVSLVDRMFFTEQLALLIETGENLHGALTTIASQTENPRLKSIVSKIAKDVSEGRSFAHALARHDEVFSPTFVNLIAASEGGGFMHEVLQQLLDMDKKRQQLRHSLLSAATYPLFLLAFSAAVVVFVLIVVFPKFGSMFASIYDQLPITTRVLMSASEALRHHWYAIAGGVVGFTAAARHWLASESGRARIDHLKLHAPGLREIFRQVYLVQVLQVLNLSLVNKVSVMESLEACRDVVENSLFRRLISSIESKVQAGAGVAVGFSESTFIPELAKHMIATGEKTGNLGKVMGRISEYYEAELEKKLEMLSKLAEPVMLLVMGVVVGVLVSSLILPIFKLTRAVT